MVFDWVNVSTPFSWCFVAAIFLGGAISRISRRSLGSGRWTIVYIYLTVSVGMAAGGLFVPGPAEFLDIRLAYLVAVCTVIGYFAFRYAVRFGVPLALLAAIALTIFGIGLRGWAPIRGSSTVIGHVRVLAAADNRVDLELARGADSFGGAAVSGSLPNGSILPVVEVVRLAKYYFFVAAPVLYRLEAVSTSMSPDTSRELSVLDRSAAGAPFVASLPGIGYDRIVGTGVRPQPLGEYLIELDFLPPGTVRARLTAGSP